MRQGQSGLFELLCLSRRAGKERVAKARPGAHITENLQRFTEGFPVKFSNEGIPLVCYAGYLQPASL